MMMPDLRTQIVAVIDAQYTNVVSDRTYDDWLKATADAVIRELGRIAQPDPGCDDQWLDSDIWINHDAPGTPVTIEQDPGSLIYVTADYARKLAFALLAAADKCEWLNDESRWLKGGTDAN